MMDVRDRQIAEYERSFRVIRKVSSVLSCLPYRILLLLCLGTNIFLFLTICCSYNYNDNNANFLKRIYFSFSLPAVTIITMIIMLIVTLSQKRNQLNPIRSNTYIRQGNRRPRSLEQLLEEQRRQDKLDHAANTETIHVEGVGAIDLDTRDIDIANPTEEQVSSSCQPPVTIIILTSSLSHNICSFLNWLAELWKWSTQDWKESNFEIFSHKE